MTENLVMKGQQPPKLEDAERQLRQTQRAYEADTRKKKDNEPMARAFFRKGEVLKKSGQLHGAVTCFYIALNWALESPKITACELWNYKLQLALCEVQNGNMLAILRVYQAMDGLREGITVEEGQQAKEWVIEGYLGLARYYGTVGKDESQAAAYARKAQRLADGG